MFTENIEGKYIILTSEYCNSDKIKDRIVLATGGFGCNPNARGTAIFVKSPFTLNHGRIRRSDVERLASQEELTELGLNPKN